MREPAEQNLRCCPRVAWGLERLGLRFPTHGGDECRATGRGVEVHACRRRAGHAEDLLEHLCYCGQLWTDERPADEAPGGAADEKMTVPGPEAPESAPEGNPLGEVAMVGEQVWREVHQRFYVAQQSKLAISLDLGLDRKTVRRLLQLETWRPYDRAPQAVTLLTPFTAFLTARAPLVKHSARILFQELRQQQYAGSYETVKRFVQPLRTAAVAAEGTQTRFETAPGQQSQIDWGQAQVAFRHGGDRAVHFFVLTLGFSRRSFYAAYLGETLGQFLDAHERAFEHFGGHTREHLYDRPRTVCHPGGRGGRRWNVTFKAFADYWGFEPRLCRAYRPRTKGKVESGVRYVKGNFLPGRVFLDDRDLGEQLAQWQAEIADVRVHGTTHERPCDRFQREQPCLVPTLGHRGFALETRQPRIVAEDYLVSFESNRYSVPFALIGQTVAVQRQGGRLLIFQRDHLVAEHALLAGKYQTVIRPDHGPGAIARNARRVHSTDTARRDTPPRPPFPEVETRDPALYDALCAAVAVPA
jgi:transposase